MLDHGLHRRRADSAAVAGDSLVLHRIDGVTARVAVVVDQLDDHGFRQPLVEDVLLAFPYAEPFAVEDRRREPAAPLAGRRVRLLAPATTPRRGPFGLFRARPPAEAPCLPPGHDVVLRLGDRRSRAVRVDPDALDLTYVLGLADAGEDALGLAVRDRLALQSADLVWCSSRRTLATLRRRWRVEATLLYPPAEPPVPLAMVPPDRRVLAVVDGAGPHWLHRLETLARLRPDLRVLTHGTPQRPRQRERGPLVALTDTGPLGFLAEVEAARAVILPQSDAFDVRAVWAQAAGVPVITPANSAAAESLLGLDQREPTGVLLEDGGVEALADAIAFVEANPQLFPADRLAAHALRWSRPRFRRTLKSLVLDAWCAHLGRAPDSARRPRRAVAVPAEGIEA